MECAEHKRREIVESGSPLRRHSMNQRKLGIEVDGTRKLFGSGRHDRRAARLEERGARQNLGMRNSPSVTTEELEAVRAELAARINRCFYGQGTIFDRNFIVDNLPVFEDPVGDGSITILDLNASLA